MRAVIVTSPGFQDEEFVYCYYRLLEAGCSVDVATKDGVLVYGKYGIPARATIATNDLRADEFDLVIIPGVESADTARLLPEVLNFVRDLDRQTKLVTAIGHGARVLIAAGITNGRQMTASASAEEDIRSSGAQYKHKAPVVIDGNMITSPHHQNSPQFMKAVLQQLSEAGRSE